MPIFLKIKGNRPRPLRKREKIKKNQAVCIVWHFAEFVLQKISTSHQIYIDLPTYSKMTNILVPPLLCCFCVSQDWHAAKYIP
jgi:hypothetical protein